MSPFTFVQDGITVKVCQWNQAVLIALEDGDGSWLAQVAHVDGAVRVQPQRANDWPLPVWTALSDVLRSRRVATYVRKARWDGNVRLVDGGGS